MLGVAAWTEDFGGEYGWRWDLRPAHGKWEWWERSWDSSWGDADAGCWSWWPDGDAEVAGGGRLAMLKTKLLASKNFVAFILRRWLQSEATSPTWWLRLFQKQKKTRSRFSIISCLFVWS